MIKLTQCFKDNIDEKQIKYITDSCMPVLKKGLNDWEKNNNDWNEVNKCLNCNKIQDTPLIISAKDINNYPQIDKDLIDPKTIEICEYCFSNDILIGYGSDSKFNICNNCNKTNINGMRILEKFKKYFKIKEKNIVNPQIIKICNNCYGDNFKMVLDNDNTINLCTNCNSNFDSSISIFEHNKEMYPLKKDIYFNLFNT